MKRIFVTVAFVLGAGPSQAMFCGSALVNEGQSKFEVLSKCGEPAFADSHVIYLPDPAWGQRQPGYNTYGYPIAPPAVPVVVDEWVYNFGPAQMMPRLVFRNGALWTIRYLGYGSY